FLVPDSPRPAQKAELETRNWKPETALPVCLVPASPRRGVIRQALAGDVAQRLVDPAVSLRVQGGVVRVFQELRNHTAALFLGQHAGLRQAAGSTLPHHCRRIVVKRLQQRSDGLIRSQVSQALYRPASDCRIGVLQLTDKVLIHSLRLDPAATQQSPLPYCPNPCRG